MNEAPFFRTYFMKNNNNNIKENKNVRTSNRVNESHLFTVA